MSSASWCFCSAWSSPKIMAVRRVAPSSISCGTISRSNPRIRCWCNVTGLAIFAHGSVVESANEAVRVFTGELARRGGFTLIEACFLELGQPDLPEAVRRLVERGATRIIVIPYFLTTGTHLTRDLPSIVRRLADIYKDVQFDVTGPMDGHPALVDVLLDRARGVMEGGGGSESATG